MTPDTRDQTHRLSARVLTFTPEASSAEIAWHLAWPSVRSATRQPNRRSRRGVE